MTDSDGNPSSPIYGRGRERFGNQDRERREHSFNTSTTYFSLGNLPESKHLAGHENYAAWSFLMKAILIAEGTWKAVTGEDDSQDKSDRAFSKICLNVREEVHNCIYNLSTAKEIWEKLKRTYSESGLVLRCSILRSLFKSSLDQFGSMNEYINHILSLQQRLTSMKHGLDDKFLAVVMLSGLSEDYEPIVMTLESSEDTLTTDIVRRRLLQHNLHKSSAANDSNSCAVACSSHQRFNPARRQAPSFVQQSSNQSSNEIICYNCNKPGHKKPGCPDLNRTRKMKGGKPARAHVADSEDQGENHQQAKMATVSTLNMPTYQGDQEALV